MVTNIVPTTALCEIYRAGTPTPINADLYSLEQLLNAWSGKGPPGRMENSGAMHTEIERRETALATVMAPAGTKAITVILEKLFRVLPMPPADAIPVWLEMLEPYPADEVARAVDAVIRTHRWNTPPLIGNVIEQIEQDELHRRRQSIKREVEKLRFRFECHLRTDERERQLEQQRNAIRLIANSWGDV